MKQQETVASVNMNMAAMLHDVNKASDETDTTKTGSTPPSSDTASSSSTLNDEGHHYDGAVLEHLARQLEYYFSVANLEKDTYVETLRQLNDGYVPVSILQRFSKVQAFAPIDTIDAIIKAATEFSSLLEVAAIDTKTGKRVPEDSSTSASTILAVGSTTGKPLDLSGLPGVVPSTPKSDVQNTIIIREVDPRVTEEEVRALFDDEHCPPIQSLYLDVFNCWFVTLDTTSRDDMLYVMMQLRCQYLGDEPVKARLKSLVRQADPTLSPNLPLLSSPSSPHSHLGSPSQQESGGKKKQKKRRSKNNGNNNNRGNNQQQQQQQGVGGKKNGSPSPQQQKGTKKMETQQQPKPDLSAASFPSLADASRKVEVVVDKDNMDSAPKQTPSDSSSTTTTVSSSSSSVTKGKQLLGGYAAALLKAKPAGNATTKVESKASKSTASVAVSEAKDKGAAANKATNQVPTSNAPVEVKPPVWGGGRSFADVLAR